MIAVYLEIRMVAKRVDLDRSLLMMCYGTKNMLPQYEEMINKVLNAHYRLVLCSNGGWRYRILTKTTKTIIHCVIIVDGIQRRIRRDIPEVTDSLTQIVEQYISIVYSERHALSESLLRKREERSIYVEKIILDSVRPVMMRAMSLRKSLLKAL